MKQTTSFFAAFVVAFSLMLGASSVAAAACVNDAPDGTLAPPTEECDDGNLVPGDGCENDCTLTEGWSCSLAINFSALETEDYGTSSSNAEWTPGVYSREQTKNTTEPTFAYFGGDAFAQTYTLSVQVNQSTYNGNNEIGDDDFIGFALGFNPGDTTNPNADYLLIDWKAVPQKVGQSGSQQTVPAGMKLSSVRGIPTSGNSRNSHFWRKSDLLSTSKVQHLRDAGGEHRNMYIDADMKTYGTSGWENNGRPYTFEIDYSATRLIVKVTGVEPFNATQQTVFDVTPADFPGVFPDGEFPGGQIAFYGLSQAKVEYSLVHPLNSICSPICGDGQVIGGETCDSETNCHTTTCRWKVGITSPADGATVFNPRTPISGTGDVGATVRVKVTPETGSPFYLNDVVVDANGQWTATPSADWPEGIIDIEARSTDTRDGTSTATSSFAYVSHFVAIATPTEGTVFGGPAFAADSTVPVTGTGVPGTTVVITVDGNATGVSATVDTLGTWTANVPVSGDGPHTILATSTNAWNASATDQVSILVDTTTFVTITTPADGSNHTAPITTVSGTGEAGATGTLTINGASVAITVGADGTWTASAPGGPLSNGTFNASISVTDAAGNVANSTSTFTVHIDACAANTHDCDTNATCTDSGANGAFTCACNPGFVGNGKTCNPAPQVTIASPVDGSTLTTGTPTISGTANPNTTVTVSIDGVTIGTVTSSSTGAWSIVPPTQLIDGPHTIEASVTLHGETATDDVDVVVNTDVCGDELNSCEAHSTCEDLGNGAFTCHCDEGYVKDDNDLCARAPYVVIHTPADNSVIRTTTPTLTGVATPDNTVTISVDGTVLGTTTSDANGNWTFVVPTPSPLNDDGPYEFSATTSVGTTTAADDTTLVLLSTPDVVIIETPSEGDTVPTTPTVTGTSNPNATITIVIRGEEVGTTTADPNGQWTWTATDDLTHGPADIVAIDKDVDEQDDVNVIIDRDLQPVVIVTPENDTSTTNKTPTVTGTSEPNTDVTIIVDGKDMGTVPVDENGHWTWTPTAPLDLGSHPIIAKGTGGSEDTVTINVIEIPVKITTPTSGSSTTDTTPTVTGTGEPNTNVTIVVDGKVVGTVPVDGDGNWTWTPDEDLQVGEHDITARGENGTEDSITLTIEATNTGTGDDLELTGGRLFGCASANGSAPVGVVVLFGLGLVALARRREDNAA